MWPWMRIASPSRRSPTRFEHAASAGTRPDMALLCRMSRGQSSRSLPLRAFASPARRLGFGSMPRADLTPTRLASACAAGLGSARTFSTIRRSFLSWPWASVSRALTPKAATCLRAANAPNCGASQCSRTAQPGAHSACRAIRPEMASRPENCRPESERNGRSVARHLSVNRPSASHANAPSLLAEQRVAQAQSLV